MNLIDPFELREQFAEVRSLAVVGNAPSVREYSNGQRIDEHDLIVRFNRIQTLGLEEHIGSRTDILCVNAANSLALAPPPAAVSRPKALVCFVSPEGCPNADIKSFAEWVGDIPILLTFGPDLIGLAPVAHQRPLTSGTYILFTLLRLLNVQRLFVTGFTMFGAVGGGAGKVYKDQRPGVGTFHDIDQEAKIFADVLSKYDGELAMTPEVESLASRYGRFMNGKTMSNGARRESLVRRVAGGMSWRLMGAALALRRFQEACK